jgi:Tfp pilus assembly protein PilO
MILRDVLITLLILEIVLVILWKSFRKLRMARVGRDRARETDLRLTYKRYRELYPMSTISYPEYKQLQTRKAYKRAVSSMQIERMVR